MRILGRTSEKRPSWSVEGRLFDCTTGLPVQASGIIAMIPSIDIPGLFFTSGSDGGFRIHHDGLFIKLRNSHVYLRAAFPWQVVPNSGSTFFRQINLGESRLDVKGNATLGNIQVALVSNQSLALLLRHREEIMLLLEEEFRQGSSIALLHNLKININNRVSRSYEPGVRDLIKKAKSQKGIMYVETPPKRYPRQLLTIISSEHAKSIFLRHEA